MKKLLIATAALLLFVAPAMAGTYAKGTVGYFSPTENDLDASYLVHAAVGSDFGGPISAELGVGYTAPEADNNVDVTIIPVTLTALYELPLGLSNVAFNVGAGVGMYMWDVDFTGGSEDGNDFGYHVQAGAEFKLNEQVALIGEVKWAKVDFESGGDEFDGGGSSFNVGGKFNF